MIMKLGMENYVLKLYNVYINDDPGLSLTYFTTMSNSAKLVFVHIVGPLSGARLQDHWSSGFGRRTRIGPPWPITWSHDILMRSSKRNAYNMSEIAMRKGG